MPIASLADYRRYLAEDLRHHDYKVTAWRPWHALIYPTVAFTRKLRTAEFVLNCAPRPVARTLGLALRFRARAAGIRLGFSIPPNVFGPGLSIAHWGTIVVNDRARVGARCRLHPGTCLATKDDAEPVLGDDCYIGPGAKLMGGITLGSGVKIGANAVVTRSFPDGAVLVGIPAKDVARRGAPAPA